MAGLPRIYCKGSPRIRLESIVESEWEFFLAAWVNHFSSRRALSLPIRPERVVTSWHSCMDRGMVDTVRYPKRNTMMPFTSDKAEEGRISERRMDDSMFD